MSLLKGKLNLSLWKTDPVDSMDKEEIIKKIEEMKFVDVSPTKEASQGFVPAFDIFDLEFKEEYTFLDGGLMFLGLRLDKKRIPPAIMKHEYKKALRAYLSAGSGSRKLTKQEKASLKEEVQAELFKKITAAPKMAEFLYDWRKGIIFLNSVSKDFVKLFPVMFEELFGNNTTLFELEDPYDFMDWLWYTGFYGEGDSLFLMEDNLLLKRGDSSIKFNNISPVDDTFKETFHKITSLASSSVKLLGDTHYNCTLSRDNSFLKAVELPKVTEDSEGEKLDRIGQLMERISFLEDFYEKIDKIFNLYAEFQKSEEREKLTEQIGKILGD